MLVKNFEIKKEKMLKQAEFMKRIYKLAVWLDKRYNIGCKECDFEYSFIGDQFARNKLTIRLTFNV